MSASSGDDRGKGWVNHEPTDEEGLLHARRLALRYVARREVSEGQLADYLRRKGIDSGWVQPTVAAMVSAGYVNNERAAQGVVRYYARRGQGNQRIRQELKRRGLENEVQSPEAVLQEAGMEADEQSRAREWIERKFPALAQSPLDWKERQALQRRAVAFLSRRGFAASVIREVVFRSN